jgi:hypothetical protein
LEKANRIVINSKKVKSVRDEGEKHREEIGSRRLDTRLVH